MKLELTYQEIGALYGQDLGKKEGRIDHVVVDSRRILSGEKTMFFAFTGVYRDGHVYISDAYRCGVRLFVISNPDFIGKHEDATYICVNNVLEALQKLAHHHRSKFSCPVIGITGSAGKTTVKEILGHLLQEHFRVTRSPKSYNSQLGVALSLLELSSDTEIALIEAGISKPGEMDQLAKLIRPDIGILTSIGTAHRENFKDRDQILKEKIILFNDCPYVLCAPEIHGDLPKNQYHFVDPNNYIGEFAIGTEAPITQQNISLAIACALHLGMKNEQIRARLQDLRPIAMRLETFEGVHQSLIINDTYNLDEEGLLAALQYQRALAGDRNRIVIIGTSSEKRKSEIKDILQPYQPIALYFSDEVSINEIPIENSVVLIKGERAFKMEQLAASLRKQKHETYLEIDLSAIRSNISALKENVPSSVKVLCMVKASSYGSGAERLASYLERTGVAYLGVAYPDEGAELRKAGVQLPIMVMNADQGSFDFCIDNRLEPAIFDLDQLDAFIRTLIYRDRIAYPIHIKLETGMNRLGFHETAIEELIEMLQSQPEVQVKSVYSHLATSDDPNSSLVHQQAQQFEGLSTKLSSVLGYPILRHLLNSEGVINYPNYHFDMIRIGIAMYGISSDKEFKKQLKPAIRWSSTISQIKRVKAGENIGYGGRAFLDRDGKIAVIPVGYADGFRRSLSNGKGTVVIEGTSCKTVGNVCMDMIMVDVSELNVKNGTAVEIIGDHQSIEQLAAQMDTIPYEVLTGISKRVPRIYLED